MSHPSETTYHEAYGALRAVAIRGGDAFVAAVVEADSRHCGGHTDHYQWLRVVELAKRCPDAVVDAVLLVLAARADVLAADERGEL